MTKKRWDAAVIVAALGMVVSACMVPDVGGASVGDEAPLPKGKGQLVLRWTGEGGGRSLLGSAWASAAADAYELVLIGATELRFFDLNAGSGQIVAVDPGTYRVVVLAGVKRSSGSATAYLVGSALAEGVAVVAAQRTPLDLVIRSIDIGWAKAGPAYWKDPVTVTVSGQTRNPRVGMSLAGASTTTRPRLKSVELWNGYKEMSSVTGTPDSWIAEASGTVPDGVAGFTVGLVGAGLVVQGLDDAWLPLAGAARHAWFWPNRPDVADTHPLAPVTEWTVACTAPPTGITVSVGWE